MKRRREEWWWPKLEVACHRAWTTSNPLCNTNYLYITWARMKPAVEFQSTAIYDYFCSASTQHSTCRKHSLYDALHQWWYSAIVFCSVLACHACSSNTHMSSIEHWISGGQFVPCKDNMKSSSKAFRLHKCHKEGKRKHIYMPHLNSLRRSSGGPEYTILRMPGAQKLISDSHPYSTEDGTTTRKGPLSFLVSMR